MSSCNPLRVAIGNSDGMQSIFRTLSWEMSATERDPQPVYEGAPGNPAIVASAKQLAFRHPLTDEVLSVSSAIPGDFVRMRAWLDTAGQD